MVKLGRTHKSRRVNFSTLSDFVIPTEHCLFISKGANESKANIKSYTREAMAPHSSTLAWKIHGRRSLVGCSPWGHEESDLTDFTFLFHFYALEKEMATHSSVFAWRIPGMGSHRVGHDWSDVAVGVYRFKSLGTYSNNSLEKKFIFSKRVWFNIRTSVHCSSIGSKNNIFTHSVMI